MDAPSVTDICQTSLARDEVQATVDNYTAQYDRSRGGSTERRKQSYATLVNNFYDLVTDFYEFGWGQSFHFAPRFRGEAFAASIARYEHFLALRLGLRPGMRVADFGCGVGGPMRSIARFSGATIVGLNNNDYQIARARKHNEAARLSHLCELLKCDFLSVPVPDGTFDAAYAIEATCHAPDKRQIYGEVFRVLKPGAHFAAYEWCVTDRYDSQNPRHREIRQGIEEGNALPELATVPEVLEALRAVGFEVLESEDRALTADPETPWYLPLAAPWYTPSGFRSSPVGRWLTHQMVRSLEAVGVAPKGATAVSSFLQRGAGYLVEGGRTGIFTPMFYFLVRKP
ncbi:MAG: methyltransferase domain-containing protein [Myxococcales bacterium]|nr:methyltransferase domain-containing protein [Myxococcota bacterium]MDW8282015.1 methyltransferase domain-containing protein [Myxococcales bacterium]